ncbi:hypothetical protein G436_1612 [Leptospira interrogans serovar Hardjo str. Norma]|uniref:Uncharacterized protein n=1 Tax=Leptospira interrogans serovar Hardjo str. Norma TaxID=1279460 RepID=A0A0M4N7T5_LEPIR|nr:hypothetical protein G436_1612 [Leptospira interrogans serovar Hardjo str. Norma]
MDKIQEINPSFIRFQDKIDHFTETKNQWENLPISDSRILL